MNQPNLLIARKVFPSTMERLKPHFQIHANEADVIRPRDEFIALASQADAMFISGGERIDRALLEQCPRMRMIATGTVGFNHIDLAACAERGIIVSNTPDVLDDATADMAWALLMAAARRITEVERWLRDGKWDRWAFDQFLGREVFGATLGVIGMGRIGSAVARRARGFEMPVIYHNRNRATDEGGATWRPLNDLLSEADFVVILTPYTPATHHLIGAEQLAHMKPTAVLVNIARGGVVDDAALVQALRDGVIFSAGLDVYENEPALHPGLLELSNVVLAPHLGSATLSARQGMANLAADNLVAWATGAPLPSPVKT
jgi:gluconate 2-dehydrogenase